MNSIFNIIFFLCITRREENDDTPLKCIQSNNRPTRLKNYSLQSSGISFVNNGEDLLGISFLNDINGKELIKAIQFAFQQARYAKNTSIKITDIIFRIS